MLRKHKAVRSDVVNSHYESITFAAIFRIIK